MKDKTLLWRDPKKHALLCAIQRSRVFHMLPLVRGCNAQLAHTAGNCMTAVCGADWSSLKVIELLCVVFVALCSSRYHNLLYFRQLHKC